MWGGLRGEGRGGWGRLSICPRAEEIGVNTIGNGVHSLILQDAHTPGYPSGYSRIWKLDTTSDRW